MIKEILLLALVVWMVMPAAHTWKPPEHVSKNDDDNTSEIVDKPSSQTTRRNLRDRRNYILHGHGYWDPTGSDISRQLRVIPMKEKSAWEKCKELADEKSMTEGSMISDDKLNIRDRHSSSNSKRKSRSFRNFMLHGNGYRNPSVQENQLISNQDDYWPQKRNLRNSNNKVASTRDKSFEDFKKKFKKNYKIVDEEKKAYANFQKNLDDIEIHNRLYQSGIKGYKKRLSPFSDQYHLPDKSFEKFKRKFNKTYESEREENEANQNFKKNVKDIAIHNGLYYFGITSYMKQVSWWSDWISEDYFKKSGGCVKENNEPPIRPNTARTYISEDVGNEPESIDYRQCGAMNPIRHQGTCGSCWAFSATSSIESQIFLIYGKLQELSEQYLIDCGPYSPEENDSSGGCYGGEPNKAIEFVMKKGIALRDEYPYTGNNEDKCNQNVPKTNYKVSSNPSMLQIENANDIDLLNALVHKGPISVTMYQSWNFLHYKEGVIDDELCKESSKVNHGMVLVGYGTEELPNQKPRNYWLLRNSYGDEMGDKGYFKLARDTKNHCKIAESAVIPVIKEKQD